MKFGKLLEQSARPDWAVNYVNYKRAKDHIKIHADIPTFKNFIQEECEKVDKFYLQTLEKARAEGERLNNMMESTPKQGGGGSVASMVKSSWNHTEDLRFLYDFCHLNSEGIRKSLKKYDKAFKDDPSRPQLKGEYFDGLKGRYAFFAYGDALRTLLEQCASFWIDVGPAAAGGAGAGAASAGAGRGARTVNQLREALPASFPLAKEIGAQAGAAHEETETEQEDSDEEHAAHEAGGRTPVGGRAAEAAAGVGGGEGGAGVARAAEEEAKDERFERDFTRQRESRPEWKKQLADYKHLNTLLRKLAKVAVGNQAFAPVTSLSMAEHPVAAYGASPEIMHLGRPFKEVDWFKLVDSEIDLVSHVTNTEIARVRKELSKLHEATTQWSKEMRDPNAEQSKARARAMLARMSALEAAAKRCGSDFLALEKFVNLNYQAFEKLLKNHDKLMPATPCHQFYMAKLRSQEWIRNDFSDVFVHLSDCHSLLRQDESGQRVESEKQDFVRNTKKYWVPVEYVSKVKHTILQHLPVFRMWEGAGDSQLVNSVYFDNRQMQLYHGRMDKAPGAIALRLRWYGSECKTVFVERKTHLDSWTGNVSVKERFTLDEALAVPFLNGSYTVNEYADDMRRRGKRDADIAAACKLFTQVARVIESKQLGPTVRTQYMRTAFQIPFDSSVRISLDTNLAMVREDTCGYASSITTRWRRDERQPVSACEHTHFPHAILEVKLQGDVDNPPGWLKAMLDSGACTEVYKFSKFIHGSAVLLTELVAAAPYWIDDISIRDSVNASAPTAANRGLLFPAPSSAHPTGAVAVAAAGPPPGGQRKKQLRLKGNGAAGGADDDASTFSFGESNYSAPPGRGPHAGRAVPESADSQEGGDEAAHPLLGPLRASRPTVSRDFLGRRRTAGGGGPGDKGWCCGLIAPARKTLPRKIPVRVEPKTYFANERTFLSWLHMSVTLGSISSALTVFAEEDTGHGAMVQVMSLLLTLVAALFVAHAMCIFYVRRIAIRRREDAGLDAVLIPILLGGTLVVSLIGVLVTNLALTPGYMTPARIPPPDAALQSLSSPAPDFRSALALAADANAAAMAAGPWVGPAGALSPIGGPAGYCSCPCSGLSAGAGPK